MRRHILVIDADKASRESIKAVLMDRGVSVVLSSTGNEATKHLKKKSFDLVLCDKELPDMDGLTLLEIEKQKYPNIDFVLLVSAGSIEEAVEAIHKGATNYLPKPIDPEVIESIVQKIFDRRELREEVRYLKGRLHERYGIDSIISRSPVMEDVFKKIKQVAKTNSTPYNS